MSSTVVTCPLSPILYCTVASPTIAVLALVPHCLCCGLLCSTALAARPLSSLPRLLLPAGLTTLTRTALIRYIVLLFRKLLKAGQPPTAAQGLADERLSAEAAATVMQELGMLKNTEQHLDRVAILLDLDPEQSAPYANAIEAACLPFAEGAAVIRAAEASKKEAYWRILQDIFANVAKGAEQFDTISTSGALSIAVPRLHAQHLRLAPFLGISGGTIAHPQPTATAATLAAGTGVASDRSELKCLNCAAYATSGHTAHQTIDCPRTPKILCVVCKRARVPNPGVHYPCSTICLEALATKRDKGSQPAAASASATGYAGNK